MDRSRRARVEALFEAALEVPSGARDGFLEEACEGDATLERDVRRLLSAHDRHDGLLDAGPLSSADELLERISRNPGEPAPGDVIGVYRIVDELGRGGMSTVYLAERSDGHFRRRVAIKLIRAGHDPELQARMVTERQILASLDHPNIAKLLDGGLTDDGRPYLVVEHVPGLPLNVYCDRMRLPVRDRVELVITVARAVEHAHRNLVVHRDLKPSNILVTPEGQVKLLDFGIAKLLNPTLSGMDAPVTRGGQRILTPEFASPEQLRGETLTTATDVYSLGVLLYRLLTGCHPYELEEPTATALLTAQTSRDPDRPSQRVARRSRQDRDSGSRTGSTARAGASGSGTGARPTPGSGGASATADEIADRRSTTPHRLSRALAGDLDAIALMALRPEAARRYGSAESLAEDLERYLADEPVAARTGNRSYRLRKLVERHRLGAAAVLLAALGLVGGTAVATWQAREAHVARDVAAAALARSEAALAESEAVTGFLMELFETGDPLVGRGGDVTVRDLLRRGAERVDRLDAQPLVQARLFSVMGEIHRHMADHVRAVELHERALSIQRQELGRDHPEVAASLIDLARAERDRLRNEVARGLVLEALEIRRAAFGEEHPAVAEALFELGWLARGDEQQRLYEQAVEVHRRSGGEGAELGRMLQALATSRRRQGDMAGAVATAREALEVSEAALGVGHPETGTAMFHLADHLRDVEHDYAAAERLYRRGIEVESRGFGENSLRLNHGLRALGELLIRTGELEEAERLLRRTVDIREAATGPGHPSLAGEWESYTRVLVAQGRYDEAEELLQRARRLREAAGGPRAAGLHSTYRLLAGVRAAAGRWNEAEEAMDRALSLRLEHGGRDDIVLAEFMREWGRRLVGAGRFADAEPHLRESLAILERVLPGDHPNTVDSRRALAELYSAWGRPEDAARYEAPPGVFYPY